MVVVLLLLLNRWRCRWLVVMGGRRVPGRAPLVLPLVLRRWGLTCIDQPRDGGLLLLGRARLLGRRIWSGTPHLPLRGWSWRLRPVRLVLLPRVVRLHYPRWHCMGATGHCVCMSWRTGWH